MATREPIRIMLSSTVINRLGNAGTVQEGDAGVKRPVYCRSTSVEVLMMQFIRSSVLLLLVLASLGARAWAQEKQPARSIVNITGQLYRALNENHRTVFL